MSQGTIRNLICIGLVPMFWTGCFFSPRDPEAGGGEVCYESVAPKEIEALFVNLNESLKCLQQSSYEDQLGEAFEFEPTASAAATFPDAFAETWDQEQENLFLTQLFSSSKSISVELRELDVQDPTGDPNNGPYCISASYTLTREDSGGSSITYSGEAEYTLELFATSWTLTKWVDRETPSPESMSTLRGGLAGGG